MMPQKHLGMIVTLTMLLALSVSSCAPAAATQPAAQATPTTQAAPTSQPAPTTQPTATQGTVSLTLWTEYAPGEDTADYTAMQASVDEFNKEHPDIQVKHEYFQAAEFTKSVQLAMQAKQAPCIVKANLGWLNLLLWYYAGDLVPLDQYAQKYGWITRDTGGAIQAINAGTRQSSVYSGYEIAGLPNLYSPLGLYYNQKFFDDNGIAPPKTYVQLIAAMDAFVAKGIVPMDIGNSQQFNGLHILSSLIAANVPIDRINKIMAGDQSVKFTDPDFLWADQELRNWAAKGYFPKDFNSLDYDKQVGDFIAGKYPMFITGSWELGPLSKSTFPIHYLPFPMHNTSSPGAIVKSPDWPFTMTQWCPYKDQAAEFLDFMTSEYASEEFATNGELPTWPFDTTKVKLTPLQQEQFNNLSLQTAPYINGIDPEVQNVIWPISQNLLDGSLSPQDFAKQVEAAHEKWLTTEAPAK